MIYLDTHVVIWLFAGLTKKISEPAHVLINRYDIRISPIVRLELQYLFEIQRVTEESYTIIADLSNRIGLQICNKPFNSIVAQALIHSWTRDPFDHLIVANAALNDSLLLSKDQNILDNYVHARW